MLIDWIYGLAGGVMIGTAAALYLLINGRIMGASGILGAIADGSGWKWAGEKFAFMAGLILVPMFLVDMFGPQPTYLTRSLIVLIVAGGLVGFGTRLANGCTSGHGVCGISRLSVRGIVASVAYILAGAVTVVVFKHWLNVI